MDAIEEAPRRPGRPKREEVTATERRRRKGGKQSHTLAIPERIKVAHPDMEFRWANDSSGRMEQLTTNDDWDKVPGVEPIHGGVGKDNRGFKMHLLMKPKAFMEEDRAEKMRQIDELQNQQFARPEAQEAIATGSELYSVPGNKLK